MSLRQYNNIYMKIISEQVVSEGFNPIDIIKKGIMNNIENISKLIPFKISDNVKKFVDIAQRLTPEQQNDLLNNVQGLTKIITENVNQQQLIFEAKSDGNENDDISSKSNAIVKTMQFFKDNQNIFSYIIPFYDGFITDQELKVLPAALKSLKEGTWGSSLQDYEDLEAASRTVGRKGLKAYKKLAKGGVKKGGNAVVRLSKRQLSKVASKIFLKPLTKLVTSLLAKTGIALGGAAVIGGTAATGVGAPIAAVTGVATVLYVVWVVVDVLSAVNDLLRLLAQVHMSDQQIKIDAKEDPAVDKFLEENWSTIVA